MDYYKLLDYCRYDWGKEIKRLLENSKESVDIFWHENELLKVAANFGKVAALNALVGYYEKHILKLKHVVIDDKYEDEPELDPDYEVWLQSDKYLHAKVCLEEAVQDIIDSTDDLPKEVMEIIGKYIPKDDDSSSQAGFEDEPDSFDCEELEEAAALLCYSSDEFHRRDSDDNNDPAVVSSVGGSVIQLIGMPDLLCDGEV